MFTEPYLLVKNSKINQPILRNTAYERTELNSHNHTTEPVDPKILRAEPPGFHLLCTNTMPFTENTSYYGIATT